jgi:CRP/FNR family cyclic AMP-dependent transcriptional regulator
MAKRSPLKLLKDVPLFEGLSDRDLRSIAQSGKEVEHATGEAIVREGKTAVGFHLILEGTAKVVAGNRTRARLARGEFFGEMSLLDGEPRSATVVAETPVKTFSLASWNFNRFLRTHPSIALKLLVVLSQRIRELERSPTH